MKKRKIFTVVLIFSILMATLAGCDKADKVSDTTKKPVIKIGSDNYPPYNFLNEDGIPTGIDVELATEAFRRMGYRTEIVQINWEKKKELVESGKIDCIMGCFSMEGRLNDYRWAGPYIASRQVVAVNENSDIHKLSDLKGKNLAVQSTSKPEGIFLKRTDKRIPKLGNLISLGHMELIYTFLGKGYVDAVAAHEESIVQYMKDYDTSFRILKEPLMVVGIGAAFAKNDDRGICEQMNQKLEEMHKDGTSLKIIKNIWMIQRNIWRWMILDINGREKAKRFWIVVGLLGICMFVTAIFCFFHTEKNEAEKRMVEIVNYVKVQCSTYTHYNESSESKSLLRAIESARQMSTNIDMEVKNRKQLDRKFLKENLQSLWVDGILVLDEEGKKVCEYSMDEGLMDEMIDYLQKDIIMDYTGYKERSYSERIARGDGSRIDIAACARKDAPGIVAVYYYTSPRFIRNYTLTIQSLLKGYNTEKDGTIIVADKGKIIASNDEKLLAQDVADNEIIQKMKKHTDSRHIFHLKNKGTGCYGIMLKQRDYYIYMYLPDKEVFSNLPLSVTGVVFLYLIILSFLWFWIYTTNLAHQKQEQEKDEKYKAELLKSAKKAEAANEAKTEFLQRMSHDIRTPINGICGMIDVAEHYADDMEKQTECRAKIKETSHLLLELVNEVLDMSKLESDEVVLEEISFNLSNISKEVFVVIEQIAAEQNIRVVWEKKEVTHWNLIGSPGYVKRIMMNILSNAVKYNKENGYIYISCQEFTSEQDGRVTIEFICRDTGIGMTKDFQKRLFEPFAQEHTGSRTKFSGTGLGMPITKKLIEKMGGTITFESEKEKGTTFVIKIPFKIDQDADRREEQETISEKSIKDLKILLVEDNELNMEIAEFVIQNEGASVTKAWNGQEAVEIFQKSRSDEFDVILMDIMMPVMNGYEAAKMIRTLDRDDAKTVPIIAMTANAFTEDRLKSKESGMNEHIAKPIDAKLLVKVISEFVENKEEDS